MAEFVDSRSKELLYVVHRGKFAGWRKELLLQKLTNEIEDFLICQCCKGLLRDARLFENIGKQELRCAVCIPADGLVTRRPTQLIMHQENVDNKLISCPLKLSGCEWTGPINGAVCHLDKCGLFPMLCPLECINKAGLRIRIERRLVSNHKIQSCRNREVICDFCSVKVKACQINSHFNVCDEFPISCPNECGTELPRKTRDSHLESECPLQIVACVYQEYGCEKRMERRYVAKHERDAIHSHFKLTMKNTRKRISELEDENAAKDLKIQKLEEVTTNLTPTGMVETKIQGVQRKMQNNEESFTKPFCVGMYKLGGKIIWADNGFVSCILYILKGESDDSLSWPFRYEFKVIILNQDDRDDNFVESNRISEDFVQSNPLIFQKPIQEYNKGLPFQLITHADILNPKYTRDNYLHLSIHVKQLLS
ncbi:TNF receptor-associated factor 4-like [Oopsacas minuta]|uniref:TNF receptor-associated factor 4-like n=1 Tax=Oopsacas minuta TaxID=111878 RepID=A0AAV7K572_9METZ|nr:TNF receptor-associated factor 4-like [Oopsacas minuta]